MANIEYDASDPLMLVVCLKASAPDFEIDIFLNRVERAVCDLALPPIALVLQVTAEGASVLGHRPRIAAWFKRHAHCFNNHAIGTAFVVDSASAEFALSSLLLVQRIPGAYTIVDNLGDAKAWVRTEAMNRWRPARAAVGR
ncbi:MAG: hypothetical protein U0271_32235 [Polyangiaceae bacterium]